jgi:hypothetical protein
VADTNLPQQERDDWLKEAETWLYDITDVPSGRRMLLELATSKYPTILYQNVPTELLPPDTTDPEITSSWNINGFQNGFEYSAPGNIFGQATIIHMSDRHQLLEEMRAGDKSIPWVSDLLGDRPAELYHEMMHVRQFHDAFDAETEPGATVDSGRINSDISEYQAVGLGPFEGGGENEFRAEYGMLHRTSYRSDGSDLDADGNIELRGPPQSIHIPDTDTPTDWSFIERSGPAQDKNIPDKNSPTG